MQDASLYEQGWPALLAALPATFDLDETARASGALVRQRAIGDAAALLRLSRLPLAVPQMVCSRDGN